MACILLWSSAVKVHDSQAYRKMDVTRERISRILELREIFLSIQTGFSFVNAAVACAILESISGLEPSSVLTEPGIWSLWLSQASVHSLWSLWMDRSLRQSGKHNSLKHDFFRRKWSELPMQKRMLNGDNQDTKYCGINDERPSPFKKHFFRRFPHKWNPDQRPSPSPSHIP